LGGPAPDAGAPPRGGGGGSLARSRRLRFGRRKIGVTRGTRPPVVSLVPLNQTSVAMSAFRRFGTLIFSNNFESGNLGRVFAINDFEYELEMMGDVNAPKCAPRGEGARARLQACKWIFVWAADFGCGSTSTCGCVCAAGCARGSELVRGFTCARARRTRQRGSGCFST
jgi:hypothetical protein